MASPKDQYVAAMFGSLSQYGHVTKRRLLWTTSRYGALCPGYRSGNTNDRFAFKTNSPRDCLPATTRKYMAKYYA